MYILISPNSSFISVLASLFIFILMIPLPPRSTLFPYTTLFRSVPASGTSTRTSDLVTTATPDSRNQARSEEHTSELQSRGHLVCRLLLEKKKTLNRI